MIKLDSATAANAATIASANPSTAFIVLVLGVGLIYLFSLMLKNTTITQAIADKLEDGNETADLVKAIRADQIKSNEERKSQGQQIVAIQGRLDHLERTVFSMVNDCRGMQGSPNENHSVQVLQPKPEQ